MKQATVRIVAALSVCLGPVMGGELSLVPMPATVAPGEGTFQLVPQTVIVADGPIAEVLRGKLAAATGYPLKAANTAGENAILMAVDAGLDDQLGKEGYKLSVTSKGIALRAATEAGLFYGIQTLRQLLPPEIYSGDTVEGVAWTIHCVEITDRPRFPWRGMHLDVARHYMPPEFIRRFIDLIALHKMNRFPLHLTDDEAWRIEIRKFPELTAKGSSGSKSGDYGKPMFYTQDEMRAIVAYAAERHIVVIPEIDVPGHSKAAVAVHREWGSRSLNLQENTIEAFKSPMTVIATETLDKTGQVRKFEWDISEHLTGAGAYRIMFDTWRFTHLIEVKGVQLTCNGEAVFTSDRVANTTKAEGGKSTGAYDFELPQYDPNGTYVLKAEITRIGKGKPWDMDLCIRKNTSPKKGN